MLLCTHSHLRNFWNMFLMKRFGSLSISLTEYTVDNDVEVKLSLRFVCFSIALQFIWEQLYQPTAARGRRPGILHHLRQHFKLVNVPPTTTLPVNP